MAPSQKKRKTEINVPKDTAFTAQQNGIHISNLIPATDEDKRQWQGFCEIENEPVCVSHEITPPSLRQLVIHVQTNFSVIGFL